MTVRILSIIILAILVSSCDSDKRDAQLIDIAEIVSDSSEVALRRLDKINPASLSSADRHYRDLLIIKARDKAYIRHESDSLIMSVLDYAENHKNIEWYPEALYYAGRVYSDIGDSPTALKYFHSALDVLPQGMNNLKLRSPMLSQLARSLNLLRLYDEAVQPLEECISIDRELNDTINEIYDCLLLGDTFLNDNNLEKAEDIFMRAYLLSQTHSRVLLTKIETYLAALNYKKGNLDEAVRHIKAADDVDNNSTNDTYLSYATVIYNAAGMSDSAYVYAVKLLGLNNHNTNRKVAFHTLLLPSMKHYSNTDTLDMYLNEYVSELENYLNENQRQFAFYQQANYNYTIHEQAKLRAENSRRKAWNWLSVSCFVVLSLLVFVYYLKYRNKLQLVKLQQSLANLSLLQKELDDKNAGDGYDKENKDDLSLVSSSKLNEDNLTVVLNPKTKDLKKN